MRKIILDIANVENYKVSSFMDDLYRIKVVPLIKEQAKQIDDDIRECIKSEIKIFGSIVKRYGDWAKFIKKKMMIVKMPRLNNIFYRQALYYRGKFIRGYEIKIDIRGRNGC